MNKKFSKILFILIGVSMIFLLTWCAENEPTAPEPSAQPIETKLTAGPDENAVLAFNSAVTFTWDATIYPGYITGFTYSFINATTGDTATVSNMQKSLSRTGLTTGTYKFTVYAHGAYGDSVYMDATPVVRNFTVGAADADAPVITILQSPKENSYASTGSNAFFEWEATDPSTGGGIVSYAFALEDSSVDVANVNWSDNNLAYTQKSYYNLVNGTYSFWIKATDVSGASSTEALDFVIKTPDVLFAIEPALTSADVKFWHTNALRDFAYEDFYVSDEASFIAKLNSGQYSTLVWAWKNAYSALADSATFSDVTVAGTVAKAVYDFEQAGGHIWIVSAEVMWMQDDYGIAIAGANTFATKVLHASGYNEDANDFKGATAEAISTYPNVVVDGNASFTWVDVIEPTTDAETIYTFTPYDGGVFDGESCGIRYPAGATNPGDTKVVFLGFYLTDSSQPAACKAGDVYDLATTVFTDFGENED